MYFMDITTIRIHKETKSLLDGVKEHNRETYEDIIKRLVELYKKNATKQ